MEDFRLTTNTSEWSDWMEKMAIEVAVEIILSRGNIPREDDWELMAAAARLVEVFQAHLTKEVTCPSCGMPLED
jgi:hypothetical protein